MGRGRGGRRIVYFEGCVHCLVFQRISAFQISELLGLDASNYLQSFGYSLSSGVDVDANFNNGNKD